MSLPGSDSGFPASESRWVHLLARRWREPGDLEAVLGRIAEVAREVFGADLCAVFAINPITGRFVDHPGLDGDLRQDGEEIVLRPPRETGLTRRVIEQDFLAVEDVAALSEEERGFSVKEGVTSFAAVTLRTARHDRPLAVIYIDYRQPRNLAADLEDRLRRFAGLASRELQVTWFLRRYQWIGKIAQRVNRQFSSEEELFARLSGWLGRIIDTSGCVVWGLHRPETQTVDLFVGETVRRGWPVDAALSRLLGGRSDLPRPEAEQAAELLGSLRCVADQVPWEPGSLLFERLIHLETPLGFVAVLHRSPGAFDDEDRHLLSLLANQVALALSNRRLLDHLDRLHAAGRALTRSLQSETVLQTVVDTIRDSTRCDLAVLFTCDPVAPGSFLPAEWSTRSDQEPLSTAEGAALAAAARSLLEIREPRLLDDARELLSPAGASGGEASEGLQGDDHFRSLAGLPLQIGDEPVGVLFLGFRTSQRFLDDPAQRQLIEGLADYAAVAIENARRFGAEQTRYVKTLEDLRELDRKLARSNDLDELLQTVLEIAERRLAERVPPDEASILLYEPDRDELVTRAAIGPHSRESEDQVLRLKEGRGITLEVLRAGESILVPDTQDPAFRERFVDVGGDTRCELDVPLKDGDDVVGVLNLESRSPGAFDDRDRHLMETLAGQAVLAVKKARAFEEEQRLRQDEETLIELAKELTRRLDAHGLLELILQRAIEETEAQAGVLVLVDERKGAMVVKAQEGIPDPERERRRSLEDGILGQVVKAGESINADLTDPRWATVYRPVIPGMRSELAVPMKRDDTVIGVINVESPRPLAFVPRNRRLLEGLAELAVIAHQNAETFEKAERRGRRFDLLHQAGKRLARISNPDDLVAAYDVVVDIAATQFESNVVVRRFDEVARELVRVAGTRTEGPQVFERIPLDDPLNGRVARERQTLVVDDAEHPPLEIGEFPRSSLADRSFVVTPVLFEDRYYGNLSLSHAEPSHFKDLDIRLAEGLAQQLALTLHRLEEARAYQEEKTIREIGRRSYELMHRLGNDLVPVRVSAKKVRRLLRERKAGDPEIEIELEKIQADVQGVLDLSKKLGARVSRSRDDLLKPYAVEQVVQDAISGLALPEGEKDRFEVVVDVPVECSTMKVRINHGDFMDSLLNLFRNAVDAMPEGGRLGVKVAATDKHVELRVEDNGEGIDPADLERIFTLGVSTRGSSGWGLFSVKDIVTRSGGEIRVASEIGVGTSFTIVLPRVQEDGGA